MKEPAVEKKRTYRDLIYNFIYAVISVACPFIAAKAMTIYQNYFYRDLVWPRVAATEIEMASWLRFFHIQDACTILVGSAIGLVIAVISLKKRPQILGFATLALLFNLLPFIGLIVYSAIEWGPSYLGASQQPTVTSESLFTDYVTTIPEPVETLAPGVKPTYKVETEVKGGTIAVTVRFSGTLPAAEVVDKILRDEFNKAVKQHPGNDAFGYACSENNICLTENQYSGDLVYKATQKKIITADENNGITSSGKDIGSYYVLTQEMSPPPDLPTSLELKPLLILWLVFPEPPRQKEAYERIAAETEKVRDRHLGVQVFVEAGDRNKRTSWYRIRGSDGEVISGNYNPELDMIFTKGTIVLKRF